MLMPKRTKFRKMMKGRNRGKSYRGNSIAFGEGPQGFSLEASLIESVKPYSRSSSSSGLPVGYGFMFLMFSGMKSFTVYSPGRFYSLRGQFLLNIEFPGLYIKQFFKIKSYPEKFFLLKMWPLQLDSNR